MAGSLYLPANIYGNSFSSSIRTRIGWLLDLCLAGLLDCGDGESEPPRAIAVVGGFAGIVQFQGRKLKLAEQAGGALGAPSGTVGQKTHQWSCGAVDVDPEAGSV